MRDCMKKFEGIFPRVVVWTDEGKKGPCSPAIDSPFISTGGDPGLTITSRGSARDEVTRRMAPKSTRAVIPAVAAERQARDRAARSGDPSGAESALPRNASAQATEAATAIATCMWRIQRWGRMA